MKTERKLKNYKFYQIQKEPFEILSINGSKIVSKIEYNIICDGKKKQIVKWDHVEFDKNTIYFSGHTHFSNIKLDILFNNNNSKIEMKVAMEYLQNVKIESEYLLFQFNQKVVEIYKKNRQIATSNFKREYWLDKQGVKFGKGKNCAVIYHTPNISSLSVFPHKKQLIIYLDDKRDHNFNIVSNMHNDSKKYTSHSCSEYKLGQIRENKFTLNVGLDPITIPRLMHNPNGFLSTFIWTEHSDNNNLESTLAVNFGSSQIANLNKPIGGFAKHNIPVTKAIFYTTDNEQNISLFDHPKSKKYREVIEKLYQKYGFEITLHTASSHKISIEKTKEALLYFKDKFDNKNWIDHSGSVNRECVSAEGMNSNSKHYIGDLLFDNEMKYVWNYGSELKYNNKQTYRDDSENMNLLFNNKKHTPLYWKHPTKTGNLITWKSVIQGRLCHYPLTGLQWFTFIMKNIPKLAKNWGVCINHDYMCWSYEKKLALNNGIYHRKDTNSKTPYYIVPEFDKMLAVLAEYREKNIVNITTVRKFLDYLTQHKKIDYNFSSNDKLIIRNNGEEIKGLSFAANSSQILVEGIKPKNTKMVGDNMIFWFDMKANSEVEISLK